VESDHVKRQKKTVLIEIFYCTLILHVKRKVLLLFEGPKKVKIENEYLYPKSRYCQLA